jgi:hypothetical protein
LLRSPALSTIEIWGNPKETTAEAWVGAAADDPSETTSPAASVVERATRARCPIQYIDGAFLTPSAAAEPGGPNVGGYARVQFNCAVDGRGIPKLTARGYQWGGDGPDRRFKALSREADPTDTIPFGTYER